MRCMDRLYETLLDTVNKAGIVGSVERTELAHLKRSIFESTAAFKQRYIESKYVADAGESVRMLLVTIFNDIASRA